MIGWTLACTVLIIGWRAACKALVIGWTVACIALMIGLTLPQTALTIGWSLTCTALMIGWTLYKSAGQSFIRFWNFCKIKNSTRWLLASAEWKTWNTRITSFKKNCTYTLFDGLAYNTCGYFASCVVFSKPWAKCPLVLYAKPSNKRFIIPLQKKNYVAIGFYFLVRVFCQWEWR